MEQETFYYTMVGIFGFYTYYTFTLQRNLTSLNKIKGYKRDVEFYMDTNSNLKSKGEPILFENSIEIIKSEMEKNIPLWSARSYFKGKKAKRELEELLSHV